MFEAFVVVAKTSNHYRLFAPHAAGDSSLRGPTRAPTKPTYLATNRDTGGACRALGCNAIETQAECEAAAAELSIPDPDGVGATGADFVDAAPPGSLNQAADYFLERVSEPVRDDPQFPSGVVYPTHCGAMCASKAGRRALAARGAIEPPVRRRPL